MRRKLSLLIALVGVLGLIGLTPAAQADHGGTKPPTDEPHEGPPVPPTPQSVQQRATNDCGVAGTVNIGALTGEGGISAGGGWHNHYRFEDVVIACAGSNLDFVGTFNVEAAGGTDGFNPAVVVNGEEVVPEGPHGEHTSNGWSHSSCYAAAPGCASSPKANLTDLYAGTNTNPHTGDQQNFGEITATGDVSLVGPVSSTSTNNWIKFCRGEYDFNEDLELDCQPSVTGGNVIAWGALADWSHISTSPDDLCFYADLGLEPAGVNPNDPTKINTAALEGDALTWQANKGSCHGPDKFVKG